MHAIFCISFTGRGTRRCSELSWNDAFRTPHARLTVVAAGYTYIKRDEKIATNFAIDAKPGTPVTQGTREGKPPTKGRQFSGLFPV
jgi:hypothetical protein